jgi:hypothetical protein
MWKSKYLKHVTIVAQRNDNNSVEGNCSNAKETIVGINITGEEKKTTKRDKDKKTHNTKKKNY